MSVAEGTTPAPGTPIPVTPVPATSILVLRDSPRGIEVLMIGRNEKLSFAAGMLVFPGGKVDRADSELSRCCAGTDGLDAIEIATRVAGFREVFEETGVLLARPKGRGTLLSAAEMKTIVEPLTISLGRSPTFTEILATDALELPIDQMVFFSHFITPLSRPKRFDTRFYVIEAPPDQEAVHDGSEAVSSLWTSVPKAFAAADAGEVKMMLPTRSNLQTLGESATVAEALAAARVSKIVAITPPNSTPPG